jgi:hypothetical protein
LRDNHPVASGSSIVILGVVVLVVLVMMVVLLVSDRKSTGGSAYDQIGQGGLSHGGDAPGWASAPAPDSPAGRAEREREVRQLLEARSERLVRKGQPALDIDAEVAKLLEPQPRAQDAGLEDAGLEREVRQLVTAKNERRERRGEEPLDVDAEIQRTLQELNP